LFGWHGNCAVNGALHAALHAALGDFFWRQLAALALNASG
jgi:hypothetical protein